MSIDPVILFFGLGVLAGFILASLDWRWLASPEDIVELCEIFFTHNFRGQYREGEQAW